MNNMQLVGRRLDCATVAAAFVYATGIDQRIAHLLDCRSKQKLYAAEITTVVQFAFFRRLFQHNCTMDESIDPLIDLPAAQLVRALTGPSTPVHPAVKQRKRLSTAPRKRVS